MIKRTVLIFLFIQNLAWAEPDATLSVVKIKNSSHKLITNIHFEIIKKKIVCYTDKIPKHYTTVKDLNKLTQPVDVKPRSCKYFVRYNYKDKNTWKCLARNSDPDLEKIITNCLSI